MNDIVLRKDYGYRGYRDDTYLPPSPTFISENPLSVLARTSPSETSNLLHRELRLKEIDASDKIELGRLDVHRSICSDMSETIKNSLCTRPKKNNFEVSFDSVVTDNSLFFARGQRVSSRMTIRCW